MKTPTGKTLRSGLGTGGNSGAILGMALVVVVALSLIGLGLLNLGRVNALEVARLHNVNHAFWAAEAGLAHARANLRGSTAFRATPTPVMAVVPAYTAATVSVGTGLYQIHSTGMFSSASRVIWQNVYAAEGPPKAFDYALFGGGGELYLRKSSVINGNVFQTGPVNITPPVAVTNGTVSATNTSAIFPASMPISPPPDPPPAFPLFDPGPSGAGYDALIATASTIGTNSIEFPYSLGNKTQYFKGDLAITNTLSGRGVLAVSGNVEISDDWIKSSVYITNSVHIIAGGQLKLNFTNCITGTNCLIYSRGIIDCFKDATIGVITLITTNNVGAPGGLSKNLTVVGVLYAGGKVASKKDLNVTGSVLAGGGVDIAKNFSVSYTNLWPVPLLPGFQPEVTVTNIYWQERFD